MTQPDSRTLAPRSENNEYQRGHDDGYAAGIEDGKEIGAANERKRIADNQHILKPGGGAPE